MQGVAYDERQQYLVGPMNRRYVNVAQTNVPHSHTWLRT